jgi:ABC-2 type transport system ATP-binding protein
VGLLLDARAFHPTRTARNHLRVLAAAGGVSADRVDDALRAVGLERAAGRKPGTFSLGMSQRLGIAGAVLAEPRYLLLDEPANGLDPEGIVWLRQFLKDYADRGNAVFISSHLLGEMAQLVDEVVVIGRGRLITSGSMDALLASHAPATVFVRTPDQARLERLVDGHGLAHRVVDGELAIDATTTDEIGRIAFDAGIPVLELTRRQASLEDVFLELTDGPAEFRARGTTGGGEPDADARR